MSLQLKLIVVFVMSVSFMPSAALAWLAGDWILTYDPDDSPKELFIFSTGNDLTMRGIKSCHQLKGTYTLQPKTKTISIDLIYEGRIFAKKNLTYDELHERLYYKSDINGNTSYYTKLE